MRGAIKNNGLTATTLIYGFNGNVIINIHNRYIS